MRPEILIDTLSQKYGNVLKYKVGFFKCVIFRQWEAVNECLTHKHIWGRPDFKAITYHTKGPNGILSTNGQLWIEKRRFVMRELKDLGFGKSLYVQLINIEVDNLVERLREFASTPVDPEVILLSASVSSAWSLVAGDRLDSKDPRAKKLLHLVCDIKSSMKWLVLVSFFPRIITCFLPAWTWNGKKFKRTRYILYKHFKEVIEEHRQNSFKDSPRDLTDSYLKKQEDNTKDNSAFTDRQLESQIAEFFFAAADTTSSALRWMVLMLALHPDIQSRAQAELDVASGKDRYPTIEDKKSVPYVEAFIREILRYGSVVPVVPRQAVEDLEIAGQAVTKGTWCFASLYSCHRDPRHWEKPNEFYPQHFLDENGKFLPKKESFVPFGLGRRICIANNIALDQLFLFTSAILQQFHIRVVEGTKYSTKPRPDDIFFSEPQNYKVIFESR